MAIPDEVTLLDLRGVGDYIDAAPTTWDEDYRRTWSELQAAEHNKMQYRKRAARLQAELALARICAGVNYDSVQQMAAKINKLQSENAELRAIEPVAYMTQRGAVYGGKHAGPKDTPLYRKLPNPPAQGDK